MSFGAPRHRTLRLRALPALAAAACSLLAPTPPPAAADESDVVYDDSQVLEFQLVFQQPSWWDTLVTRFEQPDPEYTAATFIWNSEVYDSVGVRFKGNSSYNGTGIKKSFKIKFNEYRPDQLFHGLKKINLNNGFKDPTFCREKLFHDFLLAQGQLGLRCNHARLLLNGDYWGLYTNVEQVDKVFIERHFGNGEDGNLFKGDPHGTLTWQGADPAAYYDDYELKTNESANDWSDLVHFIDVLNNTPSPELQAALPAVFDPEAWLRFAAANILFLNLDAYAGTGHNYYLYHDEAEDRFVHIPWDANEAFGNFHFEYGPTQITNLSVFWSRYPPQPRPLCTRLYALDGFAEPLLAAVSDMIDGDFDETWFEPRLVALHDLIQADVYADPNKFYSNQQFEDGFDQIIWQGNFYILGLRPFISDRRAAVLAELAPYRDWHQLRLNELQSVNASTAYDEFGEADPWLELQNTNPVSLELGGMFLTDDLAQPQRFELPDTLLPAFGHLLIWADGEPGEGAWHANFSLDGGGGALALYSSLATGNQLLDTVSYGVVGADSSYGRYPDGDGPWRIMSIPTPAAPNLAGAAGETPELYVNEILASNATVNPDAYGEYDDWAEIYNPGAAAVSIGDLFLSDDLLDPTKWALPDTAIPAGGFLLVWCDNDPEQGPLHAPFKLDAQGEQIGIFDALERGNAPIDTVSFGPQTTDVSWGRLPDGGAGWMSFEQPTPGASNSVIGIGDDGGGGDGSGGGAGDPPALAGGVPLAGGVLGQCRPNPLNPTTDIPFWLARAARARLGVYDVHGRLVRVLLDGSVPLAAGLHRSRWDGRRRSGAAVTSGVYLYRLELPGAAATRKLVVIE